jgi:hypothetical protein
MERLSIVTVVFLREWGARREAWAVRTARRSADTADRIVLVSE